jgi:hypothetical protein
VVLGTHHLQGPTAQQQVLHHVVLGYLGGLPEDTVEHQFDQLLELYLEKLTGEFNDHLLDGDHAISTLELHLQKLYGWRVTFSGRACMFRLTTFL